MGSTTLIMWGAGVMASALMSAQAPRRAAPPAPQTLTLTGCVRPWDTSSMGAPPALAGDAATVLVLTDAARAAPVAPPGAAASTPAPAAAEASGRGAHSTYLLRTDAASPRLDAFVDQRVEVTRTLAADAAAATPAAMTPPSPPTGGPDSGPKAAVPVSFTVSGIRTVETVCPAR